MRLKLPRHDESFVEKYFFDKGSRGDLNAKAYIMLLHRSPSSQHDVEKGQQAQGFFLQSWQKKHSPLRVF